MHVIYTGERVRLRPFSDSAEWCQLREQIDARPNDFWGSLYKPQGRQAARFENDGLLNTGEIGAFAIERLDTSQLVGYERHRTPAHGSITGSVGTLILSEHWHRGFGIEAKQLCFCYLFENYPVERVEASTFSGHRRARNGMEQSGMRREGSCKLFRQIHGVYNELVVYRIFREQWEQLPIRQVVRRGA